MWRRSSAATGQPPTRRRSSRRCSPRGSGGRRRRTRAAAVPAGGATVVGPRPPKAAGARGRHAAAERGASARCRPAAGGRWRWPTAATGRRRRLRRSLCRPPGAPPPVRGRACRVARAGSPPAPPLGWCPASAAALAPPPLLARRSRGTVTALTMAPSRSPCRKHQRAVRARVRAFPSTSGPWRMGSGGRRAAGGVGGGGAPARGRPLWRRHTGRGRQSAACKRWTWPT